MTDAERELLSLVIGHRIRSLRKRKHLSQNDLASGVGSQSMISLIESGRQLPPSDVLRFVAQRLEDSVLESYAETLENNNLDDFNVSAQNEDDLMGILLSHRGRWYAAHERIASQLCHHYYYTRNFRQVVELCKIIMIHTEHTRLLAEAYFYLGSTHLHLNDFEEGERWLKKCEQHFDELNDNIRGRLYYNLGYAYSYLDIQVLSLWYATKAVEVFHRRNDFVSLGTALGLLGTIQTHLGRVEDAKNTIETAYDILQRWDFTWNDKNRLLITLAEVYTLLNENDTARQIMKEALTGFDESDDLLKAEMFRFRARLSLIDKDIVQSLNYVNEGIIAAERIGEPHSLSQLYFLKLQLIPGLNEKIEIARKAYHLTANTNHHILHALAAETLAGLSNQLGESKDIANEYMEAALDAYRTYVHKNSMFTQVIDDLPIRPVWLSTPDEELDKANTDIVES